MSCQLSHRASVHDWRPVARACRSKFRCGFYRQSAIGNLKLPWPPHPLEHRLVYKNIGRPGWTSDIECYLRDGGYEQLKQALTLSRDDIVNKVKNSGLRGRGGAG